MQCFVEKAQRWEQFDIYGWTLQQKPGFLIGGEAQYMRVIYVNFESSLAMKTPDLDPRLNAFRVDLADARLRTKVEAQRFVEGTVMRVVQPIANLYAKPDMAAAVETQLLQGQEVVVFEKKDCFCWLQSLDDRYVGYVKTQMLAKVDKTLSHQVWQPRTFIYSAPDMRAPVCDTISLGTKLAITQCVEKNHSLYGVLSDGSAVFFHHVKPVAEVENDYVTIAEQLTATPYLWGGKSAFGIDCSGLVQLSMMLAGYTVLRDSDMQHKTVGRLLAQDDKLCRGDLVFWQGHVAIMYDAHNIIHANAASMDVRKENLATAVKRIGQRYGQPIAFKRPSMR